MKYAVLIAGLLASLPGTTVALQLELPANINPTDELTKQGDGYLLPVSTFAGGTVEKLQLDGTSNTSAWRFPLNGRTTNDVMSNLRAQVTAEGFTPLLDCADVNCGGFDFRYALDLLPEPRMHVDLGDYRFLSAVKPGLDGTAEHLQLIVSRGTVNAFVQLTTISQDPALPEVIAATKTPDPDLVEPTPEPADFSAELLRLGYSELDGLVFQTGSAELAPETFASVEKLADFLRANPDITVALVGHTDAEGSLAANLSLSRKRATSVMNSLISDYGISASVLEAQGVGYLSPVASNLTEDGRRKNRRVEVIITSTR